MKAFQLLLIILSSVLWSSTVSGQFISPEYRFVEKQDTFTVFKVSEERKIVDELRWKQYWEKKHDALLQVSIQKDTTIAIQKEQLNVCGEEKKELKTKISIRDTDINIQKGCIKSLQHEVKMWKIVTGTVVIIVFVLQVVK